MKKALLDLVNFLERDDAKLLRVRAHEVFDQLWQCEYMSRTEAYEWMQNELGLTAEGAHIAKLSRDDCVRLMKAARKYCRQQVDATEADIY